MADPSSDSVDDVIHVAFAESPATNQLPSYNSRFPLGLLHYSTLPPTQQQEQQHRDEDDDESDGPLPAPTSPIVRDECDILLENLLIGASVDQEFVDGHLPLGHNFSWASVSADPKGDHGECATRGSWFKTMTYHLLHTGGFLRLCTMRGRSYWNAQNETGHTSPDWKLHFSCDLTQIGQAWDIIAALFMEMKCEIGMKATVLEEGGWSEGQRGREITVYIFKFDTRFRGYMQGVIPELDHELFLGSEVETYLAPFWFTFIREAERRLQLAGIRSRGVADGDLALPSCIYASLRNEAFVPIPKVLENGTTTKELVYPPNHTGWNAARHPNPFLDVIFFLRSLTPFIQRINQLESQV